MKIALKNVVIIVSSVIAGMVVNLSLIIVGGLIFPPPQGFDPMNATDWGLEFFLFPLLAHSGGTFIGAFIASKLSSNSSVIMPIIVGVYFLSGGIYMTTVIPAPLWFLSLDLIGCYIPMAFLAWHLSKS